VKGGWRSRVSQTWEDPEKRPDREREAYTMTNGGYTDLVDQIRSRAQTEGWQCQ